MLILQFILFLLTIPAVLVCAYLLLLTVLSGRLPVPPSPARQLRFDVIVPAHNEAAGIERTVKSLRQLNWPVERYRLLVIADNCTDATADIARAAGAEVLERTDPKLRGKGHALQFAFRESAAQGRTDAVAVIDADTEVSANLLEAFAARIYAGAQAVQVHYGVLNPMDSWRTRLITIANGSFHVLRSRARERLRVSTGIRGNGWCVTHALLRQLPYQAFSLTEDLEFGIALGLAGVRVHYAEEAHVNGEMVSLAGAAAVQRQRWERGRFALIRSRTVPVLVAAAAAVAWWLPAGAAWLGLAIACGAALLAYVLRGWQLSGIGARGILDLARAPLFLAWKLRLLRRPSDPTAWVRTPRGKP